MDESMVNDILENTRTKFTTHEERLQEINKKVDLRIGEITKNFSIKLQDLKDQIIESFKSTETSNNPLNSVDNKAAGTDGTKHGQANDEQITEEQKPNQENEEAVG